MGPDFSHVDTWLFDLDSTLYPHECGLPRQVDAKMTEVVRTLTGLPDDEADALRERYLAEHGLTLRGLMLHHGVDPIAFNALFHDITLESLAPDPALAAAVSRLPGRRLIFTNADDVHAARVIDRLGLTGLFDGVFHIVSADFVPKPQPACFARLIEAFAIRTEAAAFFDDRAMNLAPAAALGMTTVLVGAGADANTDPFVRHRAPQLAEFLAAARVKAFLDIENHSQIGSPV
ncbi:MAG TPA: pyrimidine 5'-nucleotidase [Caulobacteraceae bacterium]|nr:pyrimidine 5'-nucleotidase [Caulobacteraceae bacterium]